MMSNPTSPYLNEQFSRATSILYLMAPIEKWMKEDDITEICINRPGEIFCEREGIWEYHLVPQLDYDHLRSLSIAIARYVDNDISDVRPILSAVLPEGERIQVVMPPACEYGTISVTIRKPSFSIRTLESYETQGFFNHIRPISDDLTQDEKDLLALRDSHDYIGFMRKAVQLEKVIVVAGATGSGKTTFMKALMQDIDVSHRIITIEDVPELFLPNHPNHVHLYYPSEASEEEGSPVTAAKLLKSCLRMKPTRILLAELRGAETFDFINVAASGHGGSITSCHAGSAALTFDRLALMVLQNRQGRTLPYDVIRKLLYQVIDIVVHVHNIPSSDLGRHITELWYEPTWKRNNN